MKIILLTQILFYMQLCVAQEVIEYGELYGVKYDDRLVHSTLYEEVNIKDYFVYGKKEKRFYNLSQSAKYSQTPYVKFKFHLLNQLLVVGIREDGKVDLFDETGEHIYLKEFPGQNLLSIVDYADEFREDLLMVKKDRKLGVVNWVDGQVIVQPRYDEIKIHNLCESQELLFFGRNGNQNEILNQHGEVMVSFWALRVNDIYHANVCAGYIIRRGYKIGYMVKKRNGKYFLIKPDYDDITFPTNDSKIILTKKNNQYGLYYNFQEVLKCKYELITVVDQNYILAEVTHHGIKYRVDNNGKMVHSQR